MNDTTDTEPTKGRKAKQDNKKQNETKNRKETTTTTKHPTITMY